MFMNESFLKSMQSAIISDPKTFNNSIFSNVGWKYFSKQQPTRIIGEEKVEIVKALKEFTTENVDPVSNVHQFEGGEIHLTKDDLLPNLTSKLNQKVLEKRLVKSKVDNPDKVKVIFVNDLLFAKEIENDESNDSLSELLCSFRIEAATLFYKMIKAMKLQDDEFIISAASVEGEDEQISYLDELNHEIAYFKPKLVISLGAVATQNLLQSKDRLAKIHGQFFTSTTTNNHSFTYLLMPLFHPELLLINPNMKKTAWIDMQKAMKELDLE